MSDAQAFLDPIRKRVPRGRPVGGVRDASLHRHLLIRALVDSMAESGFADSSVTDISSRARVSRRTFYQHFVNKEAAFLAAYQAANAMVSATVDEAVQASGAWPERLLNGVRAYITVMLEHPEASLVFLRESWRAGAPAWELRRRILREWALLLQAEVGRARDEDPLLHIVAAELSETTALSIVYGLEGMVLDAIETSRPIDDLVGPCVAQIAGAAQANTQAFTRITVKSGGGAGVTSFVTRLAGWQGTAR